MSSNKKKSICKNCAKYGNSTTWWCNPCNAELFREDFSKWTSGNEFVDKFIQNAQLSARNRDEVIEWIPYEKFQNVEYIAQGGFSKVYKADWPKGRIICSGVKTTKWWREDRTIQVALKSINDSGNIIKEFLDELQNHLKYIHYFSDETTQFKASRLLIHGITREPLTNNFMLVTDYMIRGSLRTRLQNPDLPQFEWPSVILGLRDLSIALSLMHEAGLIHRDIHSGNILVGSFDSPYLADFGLSRNLSYGNEEKIFGILPYVAPEVLNKQPYTQAADIYSFGMILWEYLSHAPPFSDRAHDLRLCLDIQNGLRPKILSGTPTIYANLMKQCWDANPEKRPTARQVREIIFEWHTAYVLYRSDKPLTKEQEELGKIFAAAEEYRLNIGHGGAGKGQIVRGFAKHPEAWTVSRLLDFSFLEKKLQEKPELEIVDEEKEILDKTGYLITYRSTQLLEIPDED